MKYNEAYDKIIQAYFKDELEPYDANFCFCGNLCDRTDDWFRASNSLSHQCHNASHGYRGRELYEMEQALLIHVEPSPYPKYEDDLFAGMSAALDVLKQIHRERGEDVDSVPVFTKRQLQKL